MQLFGKNLGTDVVLIAEIGTNHEGDRAAASRLVRLAAQAGADAVKFQSFTPSRFVSADDPERLARVTRVVLDEKAHRELAAEATALGVAFFSSAISEDVVPLLAECGQAIKIASGDLTFEPVIRAAARSGKPVLLSTGIGTVEEIDNAVAWVADEVGDELAERLVLMHCVAAYPAPIDQANVRAVPFLADRYGVPVGYSNHVLGIDACLAAVALGATVVETHFTDQKEGRTFRDHAMSCDPGDLARLKAQMTAIRSSLGRYGKTRMPCELPLLYAARKGVVAARDLPEGCVLQRSDLMFARPGDEFPASEVGTLVGRKLAKSLRVGQRLRRDILVAQG